jgi:hypothetical protein
MLVCEALFRRRISELDAHRESKRFAVNSGGRSLMGFSGLLAISSLVPLDRRRPLSSNPSFERTFRITTVPIPAVRAAERRSTRIRYRESQ